MKKLHQSILLNTDNRIRALGDRLAAAKMPSAAMECRSIAEAIASVLRAEEADAKAEARRGSFQVIEGTV